MTEEAGGFFRCVEVQNGSVMEYFDIFPAGVKSDNPYFENDPALTDNVYIHHVRMGGGVEAEIYLYAGP